MQKLYLIFLIICIPMLQQVTARRKRPPLPKYYEQFKLNYTKHDIYYQDIDYKTPNGDKTYRLSKNDTHLFINGTNNNFTESKCIIGFKGLNDGFQVAVNNKTIILWDLQTNSFNVIGVTLLSIDPRDCTHEKLDVPADVIEENHPPYKPQVVTYSKRDYFDIFYGGRQACVPCRFRSNGSEINMVDKQIENMKISLARPYLIRQYYEGFTNIAYLLIYSYYENGTLRTAVNKLDENFKVVEQKFVDHFIDAVAIGQRGIEVCYKEEYQRNIQETEVYCDHYSINLRREKHTKLDIPRFDYVNGIDIRMSKSGALCVAVPHISYHNKGNKYSMSWFRFAHWDTHNTFGQSSNRLDNFDDESGYHLKTKTLKHNRNNCE